MPLTPPRRNQELGFSIGSSLRSVTMGRAPCCDKKGLKRGPWIPEEDKLLVDYIQANGHGSWRSLPRLAGLSRCGKSCRLRWTNYLRPDIKRGPFTPEEQKSIIQLHGIIGNKWSTIASHLAGRTDNEIKNFWNTHLRKRLLRMGLDPDTPSSPTRHMAQWEAARLEAEARLSQQSLLFSTTDATATNPNSSSTQAANQSDPPKPKPDPEPVDVFLRIWHSPVGETFRKPLTSNATATELSPVQSSNVTSMNEAEEEDTYGLYLDFAAVDDIGFFQGGGCYSSLFSADDVDEASLDTAFK